MWPKSLSAQRVLLSVYISSGLYVNSQISENIHPNSLTWAALLDKAILYTGDCHVSVLSNYGKLAVILIKRNNDTFVHEAELVELHLLIPFTWIFWFLIVKVTILNMFIFYYYVLKQILFSSLFPHP